MEWICADGKINNGLFVFTLAPPDSVSGEVRHTNLPLNNNQIFFPYILYTYCRN